MSSYIGSYQDEFGHTRENILLSVCFISIVNGKIITSLVTDDEYLPQVFKDNTAPYVKQPICNLNVTPRRAKLWINTDTYLSVPVPFRAGSNNYNEFYIDVGFNFKISTIGSQGEKIESSWVNFYADQ